MPRRDEPRLHSNVWVASATSFLTDVSSEMLQNVLPLFLANVLGVRVWAVGAVEGLAETTASVLKLYSGWVSDRLGRRKWLAVAGYAVSALAKPFYYGVSSWTGVAGVRWADRVGKGVRSAPRDALLADSVATHRRGIAFGIHRAADTAGAVVGLAVTLMVVHHLQGRASLLGEETFRTLVLWSLIPAFLGVLLLAALARDVPPSNGSAQARVDAPPSDPRPANGSADAGLHAPTGAAGAETPPRSFGFGNFHRPFRAFLLASALFTFGNSADAFLILRAQERGLDVMGILWTLLAFNVVYAAVAAPAGALADRMSRRGVVAGAWTVYALVYVGFARATTPSHVILLFLAYGAYHGLVTGATKALVADLVPANRRGTAFGAYHAVVGMLALPASLLAGLLWEGVGTWEGLGPAAPFWFGAGCAASAVALLLATVPAAPPSEVSAG